MQHAKIADICLRLAVATAFLYPPVAALIDPDAWIGYFPRFVQTLPIDTLYLLHGFGIVEVIIGLMILFAKRPFLPSVAAIAILLTIVLLNLSEFSVLFRDVSILFAACALAVTYYPDTGKP